MHFDDYLGATLIVSTVVKAMDFGALSKCTWSSLNNSPLGYQLTKLNGVKCKNLNSIIPTSMQLIARI